MAPVAFSPDATLTKRSMVATPATREAVLSSRVRGEHGVRISGLRKDFSHADIFRSWLRSGPRRTVPSTAHGGKFTESGKHGLDFRHNDSGIDAALLRSSHHFFDGPLIVVAKTPVQFLPGNFAECADDLGAHRIEAPH